jgi:hypothetical protein
MQTVQMARLAVPGLSRTRIRSIRGKVLCRFLSQLPKGFVRIRHFGLLAEEETASHFFPIPLLMLDQFWFTRFSVCRPWILLGFVPTSRIVTVFVDGLVGGQFPPLSVPERENRGALKQSQVHKSCRRQHSNLQTPCPCLLLKRNGCGFYAVR